MLRTIQILTAKFQYWTEEVRFARFQRHADRVVSIILCICCAMSLLDLGGCSSGGSSIEVTQSPPSGLNKYKIIAVAVSSRDPDFGAKDITQLTGAILTRLRSSGRFVNAYASAASAESNADLELSVVVQLLVNGEIRSAVFVSNPGKIDANITLIDTATGKTIAGATVHSHTGAAAVGGISAAPTTSDAIESLGDQIVDFIQKP